MGKAKREREKQASQAPLTGNWTHAVRVLLFSAAVITTYLARWFAHGQGQRSPGQAVPLGG